MTVETLAFLIDELRIQAMAQAVRANVSADVTLEWDLADTLSEIRMMLDEAVATGGEGAELARVMMQRLVTGSLERYR